METPRLRIAHRTRIEHAPLASEQGFALVTMLALLPLLIAMIVALCCGFFVLKKKSLAQAHCLQQAATLQKELKPLLESLLRLNRLATTLRRQREVADKALQSAIAAANPAAIALAKAYLASVILQQTALAHKQRSLLSRADRLRTSAHRQLRDRLRPLNVTGVESKTFYWRGLAVEAHPIHSLTPNYEPLPMFTRWQRHQFKFAVNLRPWFADFLGRPEIKQITECSVSLKGVKDKWQVQVYAANARSNWFWF